MIVAVDTLFMADRLRYTGTGKYLRHLLSAAIKVITREQLDIVLHGFAGRGENWANNGFASPILQVHPTRGLTNRRTWLLGGMATNTARLRPDVVFSPTAHGSLPYPFRPLVCTIHDAIPAKLPFQLVGVGRTIHALTWINAKLANKIITVSNWSKQDLVNAYRINPDNVEVIYSGVDERLYNTTPVDAQHSAAVFARFGIRPPFILHHGMVHLRKNLDRLIYAYNRLRANSGNCDVQLVLAGPMGSDYEKVLQVREASRYRDQILVTGALDDESLAVLVKNAFLCVIPSLYEGFCLPMLEAMACGTPTITSNSSCLPEVSGNTLEYFDPYSIEQIADVMQQALEDSDLRLRLRRKALVRAAEFSWERCTQQTLDVFRLAAGLRDCANASTV